MNSLENRALHTIRRTRMLAPGDRAGVAVSGGADSVALLRLLESLRDTLGVTLLVVHFDHALRGSESDADARFVEELARARGLDCVVQREDVATAAAAGKWNLEDAARRLRYAFFERVVAEGRASRIVVAHTADDQAETVLAHILRGTGPAGLAGIYPNLGSVVRPLLDERRKDLREYLESIGQDWREDVTNRDVTRQRARIREQLLPLLERDFSHAAVDRLAGLAELAREDDVFWCALVEDRFRSLISATSGKLTIRIDDLLNPLSLSVPSDSANGGASRALTGRLVRRVCKELHGDLGGFAASHVHQVIRLASESASGRRAVLPGCIQVEKSFDKLVFSVTKPSAHSRAPHQTESRNNAYLHVVSLPALGIATVSIPELNRRFCLKVIDWSVSERDTKRDTTALDLKLLREPLILRNWRPGDAYRPLGRRQSKKLKEMFLAGRVPTGDRAAWPVLESAGQVVWAWGFPPADEFCARKDTQAAVVIEEEQF